MTKESIYELQKIDCNCNNCGFMERFFNAYEASCRFHKGLQLKDFERKKKELIKQGLHDKATKLKFQFDLPIINYGNCTKFSKPISFIPNTCQLETQNCFVHRKDFK